MRLLFLGDVVGRAGREAVLQHVPDLRQMLTPDFIVLNGENAAGGYGIHDRIAQEFYAIGVDAITLGNHSWDQRELIGTIDQDPRLLRPVNFPEGTPGRGAALFTLRSGRKVLAVSLLGRMGMDAHDDPFGAIEKTLRPHRLAGGVDAIIVDFHAEATSEKMAMGHFLDGRVSLVVGTHTHIPTADTQILANGTAYQTDAGMCGDYDSVIGMKKDVSVRRFHRRLPTEKLSPAGGEATLCGVFIATDDQTGLASQIAPVRIGGRLPATLPDF